jgi:hypothetical protein
MLTLVLLLDVVLLLLFHSSLSVLLLWLHGLSYLEQWPKQWLHASNNQSFIKENDFQEVGSEGTGEQRRKTQIGEETIKYSTSSSS